MVRALSIYIFLKIIIHVLDSCNGFEFQKRSTRPIVDICAKKLVSDIYFLIIRVFMTRVLQMDLDFKNKFDSCYFIAIGLDCSLGI